VDFDDLFEEAQEAEEEQEWGTAALTYREAIRQLDAKIARLGDGSEREDAKHKALDCWMGYLRCRIEIQRSTFITPHDMSDLVRKEIDATEAKVRAYDVHNKKHLWNVMENHYDRWEKESIEQGRDYEAGEICYAMMRARRFRLKASGYTATYLRLTLFDWLFGFGYRPERTLRLVVVIVVFFSVLNFVGYRQLYGEGKIAGSSLSGFASRYLDSLRISTFVLFTPDLLDLEPRGIMAVVYSLQALLRYVVDALLIAVLVNVLSSRRKW
jgi:hypothetical protein